MVYEDENHQFSTIVSIDDNGATLKNDLWGEFWTHRFDGSIYWDGWRKKHKPGDVIPVLRQKRGNTYVYMTGFDLHKAEEKLRDFINQEKQDAVVTSVVHIQESVANKALTRIEAYSPVWKNISYEQYGLIGVQRGDIVTFSRIKEGDYTYIYHMHENKTVQAIKNEGVAKILKDFDEAECRKILTLSDLMRLGIGK